jgi:glyoxylase-like metal-dependent hydrolase (beta-lactamase superfamily II)
VLRETRGERIGHIILAGAPSLAAKKLAWRTGARVHRLDAMADGARVDGADWTLEAVRAAGPGTPPAALALWEEHSLFCGDLVGGRSSLASDPDVGPLLASLDKIRRRDFDILWPASGPPILEVEPWLAARVAAIRESEQEFPAGEASLTASIRPMRRRRALSLTAFADRRNAA